MRESFSPQEIRYLKLLRKQYRTIQEASAEVAHLRAVLRLPKGTEHFLSDLHGEHAAFLHILHNASGVIKRKINDLYGDILSSHERDMLSTLIYYPDEKLALLKKQGIVNAEWYRLTIYRLLEVCRMCSVKYTRKRVRDAMPRGMGALMEEMLLSDNTPDKEGYYREVMQSILETGQSDAMIIALSGVIQALAIDRLHIIGDIFDRGPRADIILDSLMEHHCVDIQWGNHDVLWMGAATGSRTCIAAVLNNSITYNNLEVIETGYGISLRPLALFANEVYRDSDTSCFQTKTLGDAIAYNAKDIELGARMHKAIAIILFKLEGQIIRRNPEFGMDDRLLLDRIDYKRGTIQIDGSEYQLVHTDFPTVDPAAPYMLSKEEERLMEQLRDAFLHSEKLQKHARFLYSKGGLYKCYNGNLLFHGCIPMEADGSFMSFSIGGAPVSGRAFLDRADLLARQGYYAREGTPEKQFGKDFLWFLWCGRNSPLFGRDHIATFERCLIADHAAWAEPKNAYYAYYNDADVCVRILREFGLEGPHCHIINGHVPVKTKEGENPVKAGGRLIVIDGGFCRAYQPTTGIAGYTLIYNSWGIRLASHEPFDGRLDAIRNNRDIVSTSVVFERMQSRIKIGETDIGAQLSRNIEDLKWLLLAYKTGEIKEDHGG